MNIIDELKNMLIASGAAFVGFSNIKEHLAPNLSALPYAITFGVRLSDVIIDEIGDKPTFTYFNHYRSVNALIDQIGLRALIFLQDNNYNAYTIASSQSIPNAPVPYSGVLPHKTGAVAAGLGWIGKNGLFIHRDYGPRVRLGTILTDLQLPAGSIIRDGTCSNCDKCVNSCPAMALSGNEWQPGIPREKIVDAKACSEYMNKHFKHIGRGSVCGICIKVCPCKKDGKKC